jgi:hypothetical protein
MQASSLRVLKNSDSQKSAAGVPPENHGEAIDPLAAVRGVDQRRDVPADEIAALGVTQGPGEAVVRLLQRRGGVRDGHLGKRCAGVLHGQVAQRDLPNHREHRAKRIPVDLDRLSSPTWEALGQPVGNRHIHRIARSGPDASVQLRMQRLELVL